MQNFELFVHMPLKFSEIIWIRIGQVIWLWNDMIFFKQLGHTHTHTHTHIYIYIYIGWPRKNRTHIFLTEIHKFNSSLFFFSGYEVDSVHEKLGP